MCLLDFLQDFLQPLFELAAEPRAGHHAPQVQGQEMFTDQRFRHIPGYDLLGQTFHYRRLADARLADQHGIVLRPTRQNLEDPSDLVVAADHWIQVPFFCQRFQVAAVLLQDAIVRLRLWAGDTLPSAGLGEYLKDAIPGHARLMENLRSFSIPFGHDGQKDMLRGDVLVTQQFRLFLGALHQSLDSRCDEDLSRLHRCIRRTRTRTRSEYVIQTVAQGVYLDFGLLQNLADGSILLLQKGQENMLSVQLCVSVAIHYLKRATYCFLGSLRKPVKPHHSHDLTSTFIG